MFPRSHRLSGRDFSDREVKGAPRATSPHFSAVFPQKASGYAVIVSKKTAKLSVTRHRLKRRTLAALRTFPSLPPSLIVYPKAGALTLTSEEMRSELQKLVEKRSRGV